MSAKFLLRLTPVFSLAAAAPIYAQPLPAESIDAQKVLTQFDSQTIDATLKTVTGNHIVEMTEDGIESIRAYSPDGMQFTVHFHRCQQVGSRQCGALQFLTSWEVPLEKNALDFFIAESAPKHLFVNLGQLSQGRPYMSRIVLAGGGLSQGNLAEELNQFLQTAAQFNAQLRAMAGQ